MHSKPWLSSSSSSPLFRLRAANDDESVEGSVDNNIENNAKNDDDDTAKNAYSGRSNAWGYSRSVVKPRERRRYERRRIRHRRKLGGKEAGMSPPAWMFDKADGRSDSDIEDEDMDEDGYYMMLGGKKRSLLMRAGRRALDKSYRLLFGEYRGKAEPGTLILVRHGESVWNANKTFTGWADPDLSSQGYREVEHAARLLLEGGYKVDVVFTSRLKRAIRSAWLLLKELNEVHLPVFKSWRLNERMYGALTGLSKTETAERLGAELVQEWRGSLRSRPPPLTPDNQYYPGRDRRNADLLPSQIPLTESLLDCMERTKPVWTNKISYELACGRNVLVVAHANTLRGLVKIIDGIGDDEIQDVAIPTGIPIIYKFDRNLNPIPPTTDQKTVTQKHMTGVFLEKPGLLKDAITREKEWCESVPDYERVMSRQSIPTTPLTRSLQKLEAERRLGKWAGQFVDELGDPDEDDGSDGKLNLVEVGGDGDDDDDADEEDRVRAKGLREVEGEEYFDPDRANFRAANANGDGGSANGDVTMNGEEGALQVQLYDPTPYSPCITAVPAAKAVPGIGPVPVNKKATVIVMIRHGKTENNKLGLFTGWDDVPLAIEGVEEAKKAGQLLKLHGFEFDVVYTSWLSRAIQTAWFVMDEMDCIWLPIIKSWRLNERMYGDLTGLSKAMVKQRHGVEQFMAWRRGFDVKPPPCSSFSPQYPGNDIRYTKYLKDIRVSFGETLIRSIEERRFAVHRKLPKSESLKNCMERTIPYFNEQIVPEAIDKGRRVLISSSENAIRGLLMELCEIPEDKISGLEIPNGLPLIFDLNSKCVKLLDDGSGIDPLDVYDFGASASYLFRPCKNPDGSIDEECDINFMSDDLSRSLSAEDDSILESIRKPAAAAVVKS